MKIRNLICAILAVGVFALASPKPASATIVSGSGIASCGGATKKAKCELCVGGQKAQAEAAAVADWIAQCSAVCALQNNPPKKCYVVGVTPSTPTASCEQIGGSPPTDEQWVAKISKACVCRRSPC